MKRHTNKHIKIFGWGLMSLAMVMGVGMFCNPTLAKTSQTSEQTVQFEFDSTLSMRVDNQTITIGSLTPGTIDESAPVTVTVDTNSASGYYLAATVGTQEEGSTDLKKEGVDTKFEHLAYEAEAAGVEKSQIDVNKWGVAYAVGEADIDASKFIGLPQEDGQNGASGKKLIDASGFDAARKVQVKVGAHAGATMMPGTYTSVINFYALAKGPEG